MKSKIELDTDYPEGNPRNDGLDYIVKKDGVEVGRFNSEKSAKRMARELSLNEYAQVLGQDYERMSKDELAAVAVSLSLLINNENFDAVRAHIKEEKSKLKQAGIIG